MGQEPAPAGSEPQPESQPVVPTAPEAAEHKVFDEEYVKKLRGEAAGYRTELNDVKARLQEFEQRDMSVAEKAAQKAKDAEGRATAAEQRLMRFEVAAAKGLDAKFADLLTGSTQKEMEEAAARLLELAKGAAPSFDGGPRTPVATGDMDARIRAAARRSRL